MLNVFANYVPKSWFRHFKSSYGGYYLIKVPTNLSESGRGIIAVHDYRIIHDSTHDDCYHIRLGESDNYHAMFIKKHGKIAKLHMTSRDIADIINNAVKECA